MTGRFQKTNTFQIEHEIDGEKLTGMFTCKRLSANDLMKQDQLMAQYTNGHYFVRSEDGEATGRGIDEMTHLAASVRARLEVSIVQAPDWFSWDLPEDPMDTESAFYKVWEKVVAFQNSFRRRIGQGVGEGEARGGSPGANGAGGAGSGAGQRAAPVTVGRGSAVVDEGIRSALDA